MPTVQEVIDHMPERFNKDAAGDMDAVFQFNLTGDGGKNFYANINDGECTVVEGDHESPSITITMAAQDYLDMIDGKLNGQMAFMTGKLKIAGDMSLAMKLGSIFQL